MRSVFLDAAGFNHKNSILLKRANVSELVPSSKTPAAATVQRDSENNRFFPINGGKRVAEGNYRGKKLVHIREYYQDTEGDMKPGKKGIALSKEQVQMLAENMDEIQSWFE